MFMKPTGIIIGMMKETSITYCEEDNSDFFYFTKETLCFQPAIF